MYFDKCIVQMEDLPLLHHCKKVFLFCSCFIPTILPVMHSDPFFAEFVAVLVGSDQQRPA